MGKLNFDKLYFLYFNLFLFFAGVITIYEKYWIILSFVILTFFIFYFPYFLGFITKFQKLSAFEYFLVIFVYFLIFIKSFEFGASYFIYQDFFFRVLYNLFFSFLISILGFFTFYFILSNKKNIFEINSEVLVFFIFLFSVSFVTFFEVCRYLINYIFDINFLQYNLSASLGFISIHLFGSFLVCLFVYLYLVGDDKHRFILFLKEFFGIKNLKIKLSKEIIIDLINCGESDLVEFKESLRTNLHTKKLDKKMEHSVLKSICAFLNSNGGILFVGVSDSAGIKGLKYDNFISVDRCNLYLVNMIKQHFGVYVSSNINIEIVYFEKKYILKIEVSSFRKEVFLLWEKKEEFYIRVGHSTVNISGSDLINYIRSKFSK
jgi:hypothetical protein